MGKIVTFWRYIKFGLNTETGSFDKAVLEAMSSGLSVIVSGLAFKNIIPDKYLLEKKSPKLLAKRIKALADEPSLTLPCARLW